MSSKLLANNKMVFRLLKVSAVGFFDVAQNPPRNSSDATVTGQLFASTVASVVRHGRVGREHDDLLLDRKHLLGY